MLQACAIRMRDLWPTAEIAVVVRDAERLSTYVERALPIERRAGHELFGLLPRRLSPFWESFAPYVADCRRRTSTVQHRPDTVEDAVRWADVVVAAGGGYLNDSFWLHATGVLAVLHRAQRLGKPTAMFGVGIGPLRQLALRAQSRRVLPNLSVLSLREGLSSRELALALGARTSAVRIAGDEALELLSKHDAPSGRCLGVNIRVSEYAGVGDEAAAAVGSAIVEAARELRATIVALPVCRGAAGEDLAAIRAALRDQGSPSEITLTDLTTPEQLRRAADSCRVIVTGSYHAAVFGLAQGVATIGLTGSSYYDAKFAGLKALFPSALRTVSLRDHNAPGILQRAIAESWRLSNAARLTAIHAGARQRNAGREAYAQFFKAVR